MLKKLLLCALALACGALLATAALAEIPSGAPMYKGHTYMAYHDVMTWKEAKAACEQKGGHLVTVTSPGEQNFIASLGLRGGWNYWLGGTDAAKEGTWQWITGEKWKYKNWGSGQPDNKQLGTGETENYLQLCVNWGCRWNDSANVQDRTASCGYICEWDTGAQIKNAEIILNDSEISYDSSKTVPAQIAYNGEKRTPGVTVKLLGKELVKGTDYTVSYSSNKNVGTAKVTVKGIGNYQGTGSKTEYFRICYDLGKAIITLSGDVFPYGGNAIKPSVKDVKLKVGEKTVSIKPNMGYTVSYGNNDTIGNGIVYVTGKGKCMGRGICTFAIKLKRASIVKTTRKVRAIKVQWKPVKGADYYEIRVTNVKDPSDVKTVNTKTWTYSGAADKVLENGDYVYVVTDLKAKTKYSVEVRAKTNFNDQGEWSRPVKCTTK